MGGSADKAIESPIRGLSDVGGTSKTVGAGQCYDVHGHSERLTET